MENQTKARDAFVLELLTLMKKHKVKIDERDEYGTDSDDNEIYIGTQYEFVINGDIINLGDIQEVANNFVGNV